MRVYSYTSVCVCVCGHSVRMCVRQAGAGGGWRLPTAEQLHVHALSASRYSYKHNTNIFQCSKHFDLFIENAGVALAGT